METAPLRSSVFVMLFLCLFCLVVRLGYNTDLLKQEFGIPLNANKFENVSARLSFVCFHSSPSMNNG
jgi:hypothetical protein